jgi:cell division protease FtsH
MFMSTLAMWLPLLPLFYFMRRAINGKLGTTNKKKGKSGTSVPPITFRDVAGVDSAKEELVEVVACLRDANRYARLNAKMPSGVLLCGPPGTGKTLLAKAVAGEAGVPFFAASASEFVELFVGRGASRIRDLFAEARKRAPAVVFIDELDAVGGKRGIGINEERDQTLNQLLTELDGFEGRPGVLLLAATNRAEVLDSALTRPGRLSRKVIVPLPDLQGRAEILGVHLRNIPMASPSEKQNAAVQIARITRGFSGAELANVVNEAALLAGRHNANIIQLAELVEGVNRTRFGINGGNAALTPVRGLQQKLQNWLIDSMSSSKHVKASPMGS